MKNVKRTLALAAIAALTACTNDPALKAANLGIPSNFYQLELNGRSFVINLFTPWSDHPAINQSAPANNGPLLTDIGTFMTTTAGRSTAIATQTTNILVPGVLVADLSQSGNASFLGIETGGKLNKNGTVCGSATAGATPCTGGTFGGRDPADDVGASLLGIAFGPTIPEVFTSVPDDGKEQLGLANDNVPFNPALLQGYPPGTFPYLGVPH